MRVIHVLAAIGFVAAAAVPLGATAQTSGVSPNEIKKHMIVNGSDGVHVGTVDEVKGDQIVLTKNDPASGGSHHVISVDQVAAVTDKKIKLKVDAATAKNEWQAVGHPSGDPKK